ncbi:MAG: VCBS repeat-containing protein [Planctomycetota bacterium]
MKVRLRTTAVMLAVASAATLVALGTFVGCHGRYGTSDVGATSDDFLATGRTLSFFTAIQVDPRSEDSAGPQFVTAADIDGDGLMDLVSAWNQSQPVQIHFQRRNAAAAISFETITLAGNIPVVRVAGLGVADFDQDGAPDVAVLVKETGDQISTTCFGGAVGEGYHGVIIVYFAPVDPAQTNQALAWTEQPVESSRLLGTERPAFAGPPEEEGYTSLALGDLDGDGDTELLAALNDPCDASNPKVLIFNNDGFGAVRDGTWSVTAMLDPFEKGPRLLDEGGLDPIRIKNVAVGDVDNDGDLDVIATYPDAVSMNVRWHRNPAIDIPDDYHCSSTDWLTGAAGQISPKNSQFPGPFEDLGGADMIHVGDVDGDGLLDVVVRSSGGKVIQWLKGPGFQATTPDPANPDCIVRNIPWRVYTLAEYSERVPEAIALGDLNIDGQPEVIASAAGGLAFFDAKVALSVFDQWVERLIVDDQPPGQPGDAPPTTDPNVAPQEVAGTTFINSILVVDLDGDGANDLVATFDRSGLSGLSNDALVWFRNTR